MAQSMYNLDAMRKATKTYKGNSNTMVNPNASLPAAAITAANGVRSVHQAAPKLPPAAISAASGFRAGSVAPPSKAVPSAAQKAANTMMSSTYTPPTSRAETTLNNMQSAINTPFTFDADNDPSYQAALRAAQQNLQVNQKNTNAQLRATGQGKSSYSETVANQLANQSAENVANNILPIYAQQAYQQRQDGISNQSALYGLQNQQDFQNPLTEAQTTGNYLPAEAKAAIQSLIGLKSQAETKGITATDRSGLSAQADQIRAQLKALGIDPSFYGADKTSAQASANNPGIRTLQGQQVDLQGRQANLDAATAVSNTTGRAVTPQSDWQGLYRQAQDPNTPLTAAQQQTQMQNSQFDRQQNFNEGQQSWNNQFDTVKFQEDVRRYGMDYALQQQQVAISQQNADTSQANAKSGITGNTFGRYMDVWKATGKAPVGLEAYGVAPGEQWYEGATDKVTETLTPNQVLQNMKEVYSRPIYKTEKDFQTNADVQVDTGKTQITQDPAEREQLIIGVTDSIDDDDAAIKVLLSLGVKKSEIEAVAKKYPN